MKKIIYLLVALLVCSSMVLPVCAAQTEFVPSITYKDGPEIEDAEMNDEDVDQCLIVTSLREAEEKTTDIAQEERDLLQKVYEDLLNGDATLGLDGDYVVRELVDVSFEYEDCRTQEDHDSKDKLLKQPGVEVTVVFDMDVDADTDLVVMTYIDGQWQKVEKVTNNGDGTVTCVFEDICPVAFLVEAGSSDSPSQTGDISGEHLYLWITMMILSAAALVTVIVMGTRKKIA